MSLAAIKSSVARVASGRRIFAAPADDPDRRSPPGPPTRRAPPDGGLFSRTVRPLPSGKCQAPDAHRPRRPVGAGYATILRPPARSRRGHL